MNAAAATADPPFSDLLLSAGSPLWRSFALLSAAPTNPTGMPMIRVGLTSRCKISSSAVGAQPMTQIAPGPASPKASRAAAADTVMPTVRTAGWPGASPTLQITG